MGARCWAGALPAVQPPVSPGCCESYRERTRWAAYGSVSTPLTMFSTDRPAGDLHSASSCPVIRSVYTRMLPCRFSCSMVLAFPPNDPVTDTALGEPFRYHGRGGDRTGLPSLDAAKGPPLPKTGATRDGAVRREGEVASAHVGNIGVVRGASTGVERDGTRLPLAEAHVHGGREGNHTCQLPAGDAACGHGELGWGGRCWRGAKDQRRAKQRQDRRRRHHGPPRPTRRTVAYCCHHRGDGYQSLSVFDQGRWPWNDKAVSPSSATGPAHMVPWARR